MEDKKLKPYQDIVRITGKYIDKDGKERNRYHKIGVVFSSPHHSNQTMKFDSLPNAGEYLKLFVREDWQDTDSPQNDDGILNEMPF